METPPERLKTLIFNEKEAIVREIEKIKELVMVTEDGLVLLRKQFPPGLLRLLAYMLGRVAAKTLSLVPDSAFSLGEIAVITQKKGDELLNTLSSTPYIVFAGNGRFRLNTLFLPNILDELEKNASDVSGSVAPRCVNW